jgi:hypothetical protein
MRCTVWFVLLSSVLVAQNSQRPAPAPIVCTARVPKLTCSAATGMFNMFQQVASAMTQVEIVIADKDSFKQENERLNALSVNASKYSREQDWRTRPRLLSSVDESILFELEDSGLRQINKVVISAELFCKRQVVKDKNGHESMEYTDEMDMDSVSNWAHYVTGYVEGAFYGRLQATGEQMERSLK